MFRALLIILLVLIALRIFRNLRNSFRMQARVKSNSRTSDTAKELIACEKCGMYIVKSGALTSGGHYYCGENCLKG